MFDRSKFLRIFGADPAAWARRWDIAPFTGPCHSCGTTLTTSIPFVSGEFRGMAAPVYDCSEEFTPYCLVRDPKFVDLLLNRLHDK